MPYNDGTDPTLAELISRYWVPSMYSKEALMHTMSHLVVADSFTHRFKKDLKKGSTVYIPVMTEGSTTEVSPVTAATAADTTTTGVSITVDKWRYQAANISPLIEVEQMADYLSYATKSIAYSLDKYVDTTVGALFSSLQSGSTYGSDGQTFDDEIFRALIETLDEADVPDEGRFLIGDPSTKYDLLGIDKFVRMDYINGEPTTNGKFGKLYNCDVKITNNLTATGTTGNYGVLAHPDAIGVVIQMGPNMKYWDKGWQFEHIIIGDIAFGTAELRDTFGYSFYTRSA